MRTEDPPGGGPEYTPVMVEGHTSPTLPNNKEAEPGHTATPMPGYASNWYQREAASEPTSNTMRGALYTIEALLPDDPHGIQELRRMAEQRRSLFQATTLGRKLTGIPGLETLANWLWFVQFRDPVLEASYTRYAAASPPTIRNLSHGLLLLVIITIYAKQALSGGAVTTFMWVLYVLMMAFWLTAAYLLLLEPLSMRWTVPVVAGLDTCLGVVTLVNTLLCNEWSFAPQCQSMRSVGYSGTHYILLFVFLVVYGIGLGLQVPLLMVHMGILYAVWFGMMTTDFFPRVESNAVAVPIIYLCMLGLMMYKVYDRHVTLRLQFHMVAELSRQLQLNRQTMQELEAAHETAMTERVRAVRATTIRDIHEAIMGYTCHQLRNPLHALRGILEDLRSRCTESHVVSSADVDCFHSLESSAVQLAKVADDVLDFQRLQNGSVSPRAGAVEIRPLINATVHDVLANGNSRAIVDVSSEVPATMQSDGPRVAQLLEIGLSNALKYSKADTAMRVKCFMAAPEGPCRMIQFEVWNEGDGLGLLDIRELFEPYGRRDRDRTSRARGLGLGLPISRLLVGLLGGQVGLEDRGRFTVYWFRVRLAVNEGPRLAHCESSAPIIDSDGSGSDNSVGTSGLEHDLTNDHPWLHWGRVILESGGPLRVMVVDDLRTNRLVLVSMLRKFGHISTELDDGDQILPALVDGASVDMCLLDIHMVRTDGRDVTRFLREQGYQFPIIAVTGNVSAADILSYRDAGFDGVLGKPFTSDHMSAILRRVSP